MSLAPRLVAAALAGVCAGSLWGCSRPSTVPATDLASAAPKEQCGNHPAGACASISPPAASAATAPMPACETIARQCHPFEVANAKAHACHELGHGSTNDAECEAKKAECFAACGG